MVGTLRNNKQSYIVTLYRQSKYHTQRVITYASGGGKYSFGVHTQSDVVNIMDSPEIIERVPVEVPADMPINLDTFEKILNTSSMIIAWSKIEDFNE